MEDLFRSIFRQPTIGWREIITLLSIIIATSLYTFIVDYYDPESNVISSLTRAFQKNNRIFYSGSPGGFYFPIGKALQNELNKDNYSIDLTNTQTAGGYENAISVLATPNSFGLIQEETLKKHDFIRDHIDYVTPLYMERMHILYRYDKINQLIAREEKKDPNINISSRLNQDTISYFSNARISTGPVGSSGRIISSYILDHINNSLHFSNGADNNSKTTAYKTEEGIRELMKDDGDIDMVFLFAGAPLLNVRKALDDERIKLMSIEPSVVAGLNKDYGLNFRMSNFEGKYTDDKNSSGKKNENISTLGSYAFLITSKSISNSEKWQLIKALHNAKENIKKDIEFLENGKEYFQLDEFDFLKSVNSENTKTFYSRTKDVLLFLISVSATTVLIVTFLVWILSGIKQNHYFKAIYNALKKHDYPANKYTHNQLKEETENIYNCLNNLLKNLRSLHNDYTTGGITDTHYEFLIDNFDIAFNKLKEDLNRRLTMLFEEGKSISNDKLLKCYLSGFITSEQYCNLKNPDKSTA
jgi:TRAP-type uncharacterized transport system substrate-binding protein